jgi:hydroxyquinol 1,2-dioxygenase
MGTPQEFDEHSITPHVIETFRDCPDPRLKRIMTVVVTKLHEAVRELELTTAEWEFAIDFLTRVGQISDSRRQEMILLSDTLGVSMLVDAINNRAPAGSTQSTVLGPFYVAGPPTAALGENIDRGEKGGEPMYVDARILDLDGRPIGGATVDVWHSDEDGFYDVQYGPEAEATRRARFAADAEGRVWFWSSLPSKYPIPDDGPVGQMLAAVGRHPWRPAHLHFRITAPGYKPLITHIFVRESEYLDGDAVFGVKASLIDEFPRQPPGLAPDGTRMERPYRRLSWDFRLPRLDQLPRAA